MPKPMLGDLLTLFMAQVTEEQDFGAQELCLSTMTQPSMPCYENKRDYYKIEKTSVISINFIQVILPRNRCFHQLTYWSFLCCW